ncbi:MAG: carbamoyl phosphate synthase large subunit, partial [Prevotella sp.]|nr:carbamoyl phosphate synthase large subunit [Prevotella sp.]
NREVKVIECNLRASRSFPFVSKILKRNFIETATKIMLDVPYSRPDKSEFDIDRIGVKASQFSFARLQNADPVLGVDMSSTGEVGCLGDDLNEALLNSLIATGYRLPKAGSAVLISSGGAKGKVSLLEPAQQLVKKGYEVYATAGTAKFFNENGVKATAVNWPDEEGENNVMDMIAAHKFSLIINVPKNHTKRELTNGYRIRRGAIDHNTPLMTNVRLAKAFIEAFTAMDENDIKIKSWQEYNA